jgi:hypothetical protein
MPSHSVKQAKVMSAIAHGWHPDEGSVAKIPLKVAKEFHAADAGKKYGAGHDKKASALRIARKARDKYAEGGMAFGTGSPAEDAENPSPVYQGIGNAAEGVVKVPYHIIKNMVEGSRDVGQGEDGHLTTPQSIQGAGDLVVQGVAGLAGGRPVPSTAGVFVGPYGSTALRNAAKETGNVAAESALVHPVVGKELEKEVKAMPAWMRDPYRNSVQEDRDLWAQKTLEARAKKGDFNDRDVFARSGWSFTADGKPAKEISDIGARMVPIKGTDKYRYDHPAGDFHKIYDVPPVEMDPIAQVHGAKAYMDVAEHPNIRIGVGTPKPSATDVGHEMQHAISHREGWPTGENPIDVDPATVAREHFPGYKIPTYQMEALAKADPSLKKTFAERGSPPSTEEIAKIAAYLHSAGENQAFNTMLRRKESHRYLSHPADTEAIPRALQDVRYSGFAAGGSVGNFNPERASAFGLAKQGLIKSSVPGRTDKLNLDVPSGSYVIPADIPSAIGQGNTTAGGAILDKMFNRGPYGMSMMRSKGPRLGARHTSMMKPNKRGFAEGGETGAATPIIAAGGEYMVHPETVANLGNGDMDLGHSILDSFVKQVRAKHISTLKGLKPPKGSSS